MAHLLQGLGNLIVEVGCKISCSESEFQRVGTPTEKARVPAGVLTPGTDERSPLGLGARESMENRYDNPS